MIRRPKGPRSAGANVAPDLAFSHEFARPFDPTEKPRSIRSETDETVHGFRSNFRDWAVDLLPSEYDPLLAQLPLRTQASAPDR